MHVLVNDLRRFNYKMTDLGQVSLYSFLPSLGPGTVMGENGKKGGEKTKQKGERSDPSSGMRPFPSQTPTCLFPATAKPDLRLLLAQQEN